MKDYNGIEGSGNFVQRTSGYVLPPGLFSLSLDGRYGRLNFIKACCLVTFTVFIAIVFAVGFAIIPGGVLVSVLLIFLLAVFIFVISVRVSVLRLHDLGWSGWLILLYLVPVVNIVMGFILLFMPGTRGVNRFGAPSYPSSAVWIVVFIVLLFSDTLVGSFANFTGIWQNVTQYTKFGI